MLRRSNFYPSLLNDRGIVRHSHLFALFAMLACMPAGALFAATPTTTTLAVSSSTIPAQHPVTLTATVKANGNAVNPGQVAFCNASAPYCEDLAILGTAQLTSNGTATIRKLLPPGTHSIYAKFLGTKGVASYAASNSQANLQSVEVTGGQYPLTAQIFDAGTSGKYTLSATVNLGAAPGTGTVSFLDVADKHEIAAAALDPATTKYGLDAGLFYSVSAAASGNATVGDFNNDGIPDLISTILVPYQSSFADAIAVLPGNPAHPGNFLTPQNTLIPTYSPEALATADFNGDGVLDIAIADSDSAIGVLVLLGDAANPGTFPKSQNYPLPNTGYFDGSVYNDNRDICVGDFNGDGLPDIAILANSGNTVNVLLNDPLHPGSFLAPQTYPGAAGRSPSTLVTADFDGDGTLDLAVGSSSNEVSGGEVDIFRGDPAVPGKFLTPVKVSSNPYGAPSSVVAGDFNGDGVPDLAVAGTGYRFDGILSVVLADATHPGTFLAPKNFFLTQYQNLNGFSIGDFNGDGVLDIALSGAGYGYYPPNEAGLPLTVYSGDPAHPGTFLSPVLYPATAFAMGRSQADLNGDGLSDLVVNESPASVPSIGFNVQMGQRTETATATGVNTASTSYAYASYSGDTTYNAVTSCDIPLGTTPAAPVISKVYVDHITETSAAVSWISNVPTYGSVGYDYANVNSGVTRLDPARKTTRWDNVPSTYHFFVLPNLTAGTEYEFIVSSQSYFSGCSHRTTSTPFFGHTFTTAP